MSAKENKRPKASKTYLAHSRIDRKQFYRELRDLGFSRQHTLEIVSWLRLLYELKTSFGTGAAFLSGKSAYTIKGCLAYIGGFVFFPQYCRLMTQRRISIYYDKGEVPIRTNYNKFLKLLQCADPVKFKIDDKSCQILFEDNTKGVYMDANGKIWEVYFKKSCKKLAIL
jgi:hypothetical protein